MRVWRVSFLALAASMTVFLGAGASAWGIGLPWSIVGTWKVDKSNLRYEVRHPMHDCDGSSQAAEGSMTCQESGKESRCEFHLEAEVASFVSRNSDKDRDMRKVLKSSEFPRIVISGKARVQGSKVVLQPTLTLAGQTRELSPVELSLEKSWGKARVQGRVLWNIGDFGLQRPTLLGIPVANEVVTHIDVELRKN
jgi:hypothetical protein